MLAGEVVLFALQTCDRNRTLAFQKPDHGRYGILRRDRNHHVHMIRHQVAFQNLAFLLPCQFVEDRLQLLPQLAIQYLPARFGTKITW